MKQITVFLLFIVSLSVGHNVKAQMTEDKVQALYILSFLKYIEFPAENESYKIGYYGNTSDNYKNMAEYLQARKSNGKPIELTKIGSGSSLDGFNIIFVASDQSANFKDITAKLSSKPVVVVTEKSDLVKEGASISFVKVGANLKFQLNEKTFRDKNLKVSGSLINLAIVV